MSSYLLPMNQCDMLYASFEQSLSKSDVEILREHCSSIGENGVRRWFQSHINLLQAFVEADENLRSEIATVTEMHQRSLLVFCAMHYIRTAYMLMKVIEEHSISANGSDPDLIARCGRAYADLQQKLPIEWKFDENNPFA